MENLRLIKEIRNVLMDLINVLSHLGNHEYALSQPLLSGSSIGAHTRHVIELFQQLVSGYEKGVVNYENRQRDARIQNDIDYAIGVITDISSTLQRPNKDLKIESSLVVGEGTIYSNFYRELLYNLEHCVHHQALIKVAVVSLGKQHLLDDDFGVAKSTITYRNSCVQ